MLAEMVISNIKPLLDITHFNHTLILYSMFVSVHVYDEQCNNSHNVYSQVYIVCWLKIV